MRADRDRRSRPDPGHRHAGRTEAAGPARIDVPAGAGPARRRAGGARPTARRRERGRRRRTATAGRGPTRQTVAINLSLAEDGALGGVVGALGGAGLAHRRAAQVGADARGRVRRARRARLRRTEDGAGPAARAGAAGRGRRRPHVPGEPDRRRSHDDPGVRRSADGRARCEAADWTPPAGSSSTDLRASVGRAYPRVSGMFREPSWLLLRDPAAVPRRLARSCSSTARCRRRREYIGFVVLGGAMTAFWLNVMWMMAAQLYWEKDQGNLELYFTAPWAHGDPVRDGDRRPGDGSIRAAVVLVVGTSCTTSRSGRPVGAAVRRCSS